MSKQQIVIRKTSKTGAELDFWLDKLKKRRESRNLSQKIPESEADKETEEDESWPEKARRTLGTRAMNCSLTGLDNDIRPS